MKCPYCADENTQVVDTRENEDGDTVRRRRRCLSCDKRFTKEIAIPSCGEGVPGGIKLCVLVRAIVTQL